MLTRRKTGFTLIEVLMVIVILGMLAGVAVVSFRGTGDSAKIETTRLTMTEIADALELYQLKIGSFPTEDQGGLEALVKKPDFEEESIGKKWTKFLKKVPKDAWGNEFQYEVVEDAGDEDEEGLGFKLFSSGPDGQPDTDDDVQMEENEEEDA